MCSLVESVPTLSSGNSTVKALIKVNSCVIVPPDDLAVSLALLSSSGLAPSFNVTLNIGILTGTEVDSGRRVYRTGCLIDLGLVDLIVEIAMEGLLIVWDWYSLGEIKKVGK